MDAAFANHRQRPLRRTNTVHRGGLRYANYRTVEARRDGILESVSSRVEAASRSRRAGRAELNKKDSFLVDRPKGFLPGRRLLFNVEAAIWKKLPRTH